MAEISARPSFFRERDTDGADRVSFAELFFDLVFVFAITQLSHTLLEHLTVRGVVEVAILLLAVWWVWMYTTWFTNWTNPESGVVRAVLIVLMLLGLLMSISIPEAFGSRSFMFAGAYVVMQVGRTGYLSLRFRAVSREYFLSTLRITIWFVVTGALWIIGALAGGAAQLTLWVVALGIEVIGPQVRYPTPWLHRSPVESFAVTGGHIAERSGLFIIIALGESILVTGSTYGSVTITLSSTMAFLAAFVGTILIWLIYFGHSAEGGSRFIRGAEHTGVIARLSYVYLHIPLVGAIVLAAVGDELVLDHPMGSASPTTAAIVLGAPALYLLGNALFKRSVGAPWLASHFSGALVLAIAFVLVAFALSDSLPPLALSWIANAVLLAVVLVDERTIRRFRNTLER